MTSQTHPPRRVAIIGSGPAGFYTADVLLKGGVAVDLFERFPVPFGLVRFGVAPDHQKIKRAAKAFDKVAQNPKFRLLGNVTVGKDVSVAELCELYDQVVFATGSATDKRLRIAGEDLPGSHPATAFVGWYNAHPDFCGERFALDAERALVIGVGNVAMDVARVLVRDPEELSKTDIADYALDALRKSQVREVLVLGRRGPLEAAFEQRELEDIDDLAGVEVVVERAQVAAASRAAQSMELDAGQRANLKYLESLAERGEGDAPRKVRVRFLASPVEIVGSDRVEAVRIEENELVSEAGRTTARGTGRVEQLPCGLVLRSIGYHGVAIPGVPFDERSGVFPNTRGRVQAAAGGELIAGLYAVGWIKRGPSGLIGSNKSDAHETASLMLEDLPSLPVRGGQSPDQLLKQRGVRVVDYGDWGHIDRAELSAGETRGKLREKFASVQEMLAALEAARQKQ